MKLKRLFMKFFWPWFKKYVWPIIQKLVLALLEDLADDIKATFEKWMAGRHIREQEAVSNAEQAGQARDHAAASGDFIEAEVQRRVEAIWRQVAETIRAENQSLNRGLATVIVKTDNTIDAVKTIDVDARDGEPTVRLGTTIIPLLMPGQDEPT